MFLGAKMADNFFWKCTFCSLNGMFGVLNRIGQHVKGAAHVLAKKKRETCGIVGNEMSIQDFFTKGVLVRKLNILCRSNLLILFTMNYFPIVHNMSIMDFNMKLFYQYRS
jgi:hypothetical protein